MDGISIALRAMQQELDIEENNPEVRKFSNWESVLRTLFPRTFSTSFSQAQKKYWDWVWDISRDKRPRPYVLLLPRGGGKTTSAEITPILLGAENIRSYCWYVQETQSQSDKRISNIAAWLESSQVSLNYPLMGERWTGKFGNIGGWRRSYVRTASNVIFEAIGLDKAARSSKVGDQRPDIVIIDDIDNKFDTDRAVKRKLDTLTHTLLPSIAHNAVIIFVQNLIHHNSIASLLADTKNIEFLQDRIISGPYPAIKEETFDTERIYDEELGRYIDKITAGTPLWEGQDLDACQAYINTFGLTSFKTECQHEVENITGSIFSNAPFRHCNFEDMPELETGCVWCDPAVTDKEDSDSNGIQADGLGVDGKIYRIYSLEERDGPLNTLKTAILWAIDLGFDNVGVETDQGGDTWRVVYNTAWRELVEDLDYPEIGDTTPKPEYHEEKAGAGHGSKAHRGNLLLSAYESDQLIHVIGDHKILESSLYRFLKVKPYDLADCAYYGWYFLSNRKWEENIAYAR